ncbi:PREDICTED: L-type lectin-domain containing receptor kinase IV.1-like [Tarenaya hassleriana]|uniref:L-type lectin-domain containing receptor kinase IV.1-like n=1 Tax=Tarenaya hassleriana TaxID=28532 RepID=UPI00053C956C|nr:PREDICTED: L-type lectin-domain containing receptor kinase IV.1-like [Tarenaya hassleriana]
MFSPSKPTFSSFFFFFLQTLISASQDLSFTFDGFRSSSPTNLTLDGITAITPSRLLRLTNTTRQRTGHAFYTKPVRFKTSRNGTVSSFSTTFVFAIVSEVPTFGHGMAFVVAPQPSLPTALPSHFLGLFNDQNNGNDTNHVFAVELDTIQSNEFGDINDNHVGIDLNGLRSEKAEPAGYWDNTGRFVNLTLLSRNPMQMWIDYDGATKQMNVTMAPIFVNKPKKPLLSLIKDLSPVLLENMYVGFSSSTGSVYTENYVLGWSFRMNGDSPPLTLSKLPELPRIGPENTNEFLRVGLPLISLFLLFLLVFAAIYIVKRKKKFAEEHDGWELEFGTNRFKFKDLYYATKGFKESELLGKGGFGKVYRGIMPKTNLEIAVKRVSHDSKQGMREFVAEIVSIGRMSHRNLVPLLGYCRRKGELLLVYDYMPNGSLDRYLHNNPYETLDWKQRFKVINGVASGLFYLHEGWEQMVVHRDVKASNVLLDGDLNARLGDFGLARLYNHGSDPHTSRIVGTLGYVAPEHARSGKATTATDVFAFGVFLLEVACGKRPIEFTAGTDETSLLVDRVFGFWSRGNISDSRDPNLGSDYDQREVELVLKLGLLCSHHDPRIRPSMRRVLQYLQEDIEFPNLSPSDLSENGLMFAGNEDKFRDLAIHFSSSTFSAFTGPSSVTNSLLSSGRLSHSSKSFS